MIGVGWTVAAVIVVPNTGVGILQGLFDLPGLTAASTFHGRCLVATGAFVGFNLHFGLDDANSSNAAQFVSSNRFSFPGQTRWFSFAPNTLNQVLGSPNMFLPSHVTVYSNAFGVFGSTFTVEFSYTNLQGV